MRKILLTLGAVAMSLGWVLTAQPVQAAQVTHDTTVVAPAPAPTVQAFDCAGTTGSMGCGPGWFWRDGWRGWACYPC
jgi:hypothetical protein